MTIHSRKTISPETLLQADFLATCSSQTKQEVIQELNTEHVTSFKEEKNLV